jgi:hypothetical protein
MTAAGHDGNELTETVQTTCNSSSIGNPYKFAWKLLQTRNTEE